MLIITQSLHTSRWQDLDSLDSGRAWLRCDRLWMLFHYVAVDD